MEPCTDSVDFFEETEDPNCTKQFKDDLTFLLMKHYGSAWTFTWDVIEDGISMNVVAWTQEDKKDEVLAL
tara:strand:- start:542 stop:751 length:210 start_codon:yes stop_codon:yes gene_type:complete